MYLLLGGVSAIMSKPGEDNSAGFHGPQHPDKVHDIIPEYYIGDLHPNDHTQRTSTKSVSSALITAATEAREGRNSNAAVAQTNANQIPQQEDLEEEENNSNNTEGKSEGVQKKRARSRKAD